MYLSQVQLEALSMLTQYVWVVHVAVSLLNIHLGNGTGHSTVTMAAPLVLTSGVTSGLARYEAVLHSCGTIPVGGRGGGVVGIVL